MNCPHVAAAVRILRLDIEHIKRHADRTHKALDVQVVVNTWRNGHKMRISQPDSESDYGNWNCVECGSTLSPWLCLYCGLIHCGRYVNQDGLKHFRQCREHGVCMDCHNYSVFCYWCDEFVGNDTEDSKLESVRESLKYYNRLRYGDHNYFSPRFLNPSLHQPRTTLMSTPRRVVRAYNVPQSPLSAAPISVFVKTQEPTNQQPRVHAPSAKRPRVLNGKVTKNRIHKVTTQNKKPVRRAPVEKRTSESDEKETRLRGLRNLGNTCFMNAVLQSLNNIDEFCYYFMKLPEIMPPNSAQHPRYNTRRSQGPTDAFLTEELRKTLVALSEESNTTAIAPDALFSVVWKLVPRFRGFQQQDAHEFLRCVLDRLNCELRSVRPEDEPKDGEKGSLVTALFEGNLQSTVICMICDAFSRKHDPFLDLSLDIPAPQNGTKNGSNVVRLTDCLRRFFDKEHLDSSEQYFCERCRRKGPSTKQFFIRRSPNVLCLHLKRFRWTRHDRRKVEGFVEFPLKGLDLRQFALESSPKSRRVTAENHGFDLAALIVHQGSGVASGHYTAFARREGSWYHFNDTCVRRCAEQLVAQQKAYILFYVRRKPEN